MKYFFAILCLVALLQPLPATGDDSAKPNIVYIMTDELGYFEPGFMGGPDIQTPNLDRMAAEGMRFNNLFAGSSVCAPTRCCFLTGKHSGHTSVRSNGGGTPLRADEPTIASMLKPLGYSTGGFGKWGTGGRDSTGVPEKHGFDVFLGYYDQVHAHSYYPPYLIRNSEEVPLMGNVGVSGETYSHYVIHEAAVQFIRDNSKNPFFAYLPITPPHGLFNIPDSDPAWAIYKDKPWPEQVRRYAAMVTMVDRQIGEILGLLRELGIADNTLVFFSGDNGGADYFATKEQPRGFFKANVHPKTGVEYRGRKGNLYEGGLRIPFLAYWPGKIKPGTVSHHLGYFPDILPTIADVTGAKPPADIDGISILPELIGEQAAGHAQKEHEYLYWEIGGQTAIRRGDWRAVRPSPKANWELYNLSIDPSESNDVAADHSDIARELSELAERAHEPVREGTFARTDRHERDRRAKFGKHDDPAPPQKAAKETAKYSLPVEGMISNKKWKVLRASSENSGNGKYAANAIDGDPNTLWHTRFSPSLAPPPHELVIDLGATHQVDGLVYLARQDNGWNGTVAELEVFVANDPEQFGTPVGKAKLTRTKKPQTMTIPETSGRYVLVRILSEINGNAFASAAEFGLRAAD
ncbi:sulfatase-like hydrolase/transferase [Stieleria varia]|uniref:Arylsulfatase n=1 Tax=Stieleria varia TaxID=2528005 RepID=A0A5C6A3C6_9BACT|nr:sulfatase-like hydrolase/transferase [Stieleria varia]TWT93906.1 Arylsulfatase [Stieleria varia]